MKEFGSSTWQPYHAFLLYVPSSQNIPNPSYSACGMKQSGLLTVPLSGGITKGAPCRRGAHSLARVSANQNFPETPLRSPEFQAPASKHVHAWKTNGVPRPAVRQGHEFPLAALSGWRPEDRRKEGFAWRGHYTRRREASRPLAHGSTRRDHRRSWPSGREIPVHGPCRHRPSLTVPRYRATE